MKNYILLSFALFCFSFIGKAQAPDYDDLIILFADGKYEKLIDECLKYNDKDATRNDALPYFYLAKGYYGLSQQGDRAPEYKNAFKSAAQAMGKFYKKDKAGSFYAENEEFIENFKSAAAEIMLNEYEAKNYRKSATSANVFKKTSPDNIGADFMIAASKFMDKDRSSAISIWRDVEKSFLELESINTNSVADVRVYKEAIIATAECMIQAKQVDRARKILEKGQELIQEEDFKKECQALY